VVSSLAPEQLIAAWKDGIEITFGILIKMSDSTGKLPELDAQTVKSTFAKNQELMA